MKYGLDALESMYHNDPTCYEGVHWCLNKAFYSETDEVFNNAENDYYTHQIESIDPNKITSQIVINMITTFIIRDKGRYKEYFLGKFQNLKPIVEKAKPLDEPFIVSESASKRRIRNDYLKRYNMFLTKVY